MKAKRAIVWSLINVVTGLVVKFGSLIVLSRLLTPADFGLYNVGMALVLMGTLVAQLGVPTNLIALKEISPRLVVTGLALSVAVSMALSAAALVLATSVASVGSLMPPGVAPLIAATCVAQVVVNVLEAVARRSLRLRLLTVSELIAGLVGNLLAAVILAWIGFGAAALVIGQLIYTIAKIGILVPAVRQWLSAWPAPDELARITAGGTAIVIAEVANMAAVQIQRPIVGATLGLDAAGIWSRAYQIIVLQLAVAVQPLDNLILPVLSRERHSGRDIGASLTAGVWAVSLTTLPLSAMTALFAPNMVPFLFGPQWTALITPLQILAPLVFFRGLERIMLSSSRVAGTMNQRAAIQVVQLAIILIVLALTLTHGLIAASWGYLGATVIGFAITVWRSRQTTGISAIQLLVAISPGAAAGGCGLAVAAAWMCTGQSPYAWPSLATASAVMALLTLVILFRRLRAVRLTRAIGA